MKPVRKSRCAKASCGMSAKQREAESEAIFWGELGREFWLLGEHGKARVYFKEAWRNALKFNNLWTSDYFIFEPRFEGPLPGWETNGR